MSRHRILLVPTVTELEWRIKPQLEEWAEVASYDAPGVGGEPATELTPEAIAERGLAEIERRGWESCVVVGDEAGAAQAVRIAGARPEAVAGIALGHATLSFESNGPRAALNAEVLDGVTRVARTDFRSFVRALSQLTQHAYDDEFADGYIERVDQETALAYFEQLLVAASAENTEHILRSLPAPKLLVEHRDCLMWTGEGYEDAVAAFPDAKTAAVELKPSFNPEFAELLREFCAELPE